VRQARWQVDSSDCRRRRGTNPRGVSQETGDAIWSYSRRPKGHGRGALRQRCLNRFRHQCEGVQDSGVNTLPGRLCWRQSNNEPRCLRRVCRTNRALTPKSKAPKIYETLIVNTKAKLNSPEFSQLICFCVLVVVTFACVSQATESNEHASV
jgi:hypothetical protein